VENLKLVAGNVNSPFSLVRALSEGYTIKLAQDGDARIRSLGGQEYYVRGFTCNCTTPMRRKGDGNQKRCKHAVWTEQVHPCRCGGLMMLKYAPSGDSEDLTFVCQCGAVKSFEDVAKERRTRSDSKDNSRTTNRDTKSLRRWRRRETPEVTSQIGGSDYIPEHIEKQIRAEVSSADWRKIVEWTCKSCGWEGKQRAGSNACPECLCILTRTGHL
jgi:hypothetical protein